ncbi:hypothetical protein B0J12DRAFT_706933 [Macrophomina phaseolina]|uniref:Aminoglycoside phosphotransferase domain-containing protein n=1 Tax=Macrophomina phaseolina TaxID=35725 RepID=A0ABQ8GW09_9PEZI|nr:hypothetical protein B0J12DRAFT_706933 [Macrophomina phaseolina]
MEPEPVKTSWLCRYTVLVLIALLKRFRRRKGNVLMLTGQLCVKCGPLVHLSEDSSMRFLAQKTSIPVPKAYCAFVWRGWTYILMERIRGDMVGQGWIKRREESRARVLAELKRLVQEMRDIPAPGPEVRSIDGGSPFDPRLPGPCLRFGPFKNIQDFHKHLRGGLESNPNLDPEIVGIVDWETAGWFPSYWEYTTASQVNPQNSFCRDEIDKFLDPMAKELKYFGDF